MPFPCPHCGEDIPDNAASCPYCGSDAETGWLNENEIDYHSLDLPTGYSNSSGDEDSVDTIYGKDSKTPSSKRPAGSATILIAFLIFASLGYNTYGSWVILPSIFLVVGAILFLRYFSKRPPKL